MSKLLSPVIYFVVLTFLSSLVALLLISNFLVNAEQQTNNNNNHNNKNPSSSLKTKQKPGSLLSSLSTATTSKKTKKNNNNKKKKNSLAKKSGDASDQSWSFPGSSGSWWWSSSTGDSTSSSKSGSDGSSAYSAGSSFYAEPADWHNAGKMKIPFAHACSTFTLKGHMRFFGGYYSRKIVWNKTTETQTVLSQSVFDLQFPDTRELVNISLPTPLENVTGTTSCSFNLDTGITFVMAGNTKSFSSSAVYYFPDELYNPIDVSLPFAVNRSSIAATVIEDEQLGSSSAPRGPTSDSLRYFDENGKPVFAPPRKSSLGNSSGNGTVAFVPDAVIIGGEGVTSMYGLHLLTSEWRKMCDWDRPLCDCSVIAQPYERFMMACTDCTSQPPAFTVYIANLTCYLWDMKGPTTGTAVTTAIGLTYLQSLRFGKFSVFAFRPVDYYEYILLNLFDHEFETWIPLEPKKGLDPPRTDGGIFSWLGRMQVAGGENIGLEAMQEIQEAKLRQASGLEASTSTTSTTTTTDRTTLLTANAESANFLGGKMDEEGAFYPAPNTNNNNNNNDGAPNLLSALLLAKQQESKRSYQQHNALTLEASPSSSLSPLFINNDFTVSDAIQDIPIVKIPTFALVPETKTSFTVGEQISLACPRNSFVILSYAPDCFRLLDGTAAAKCNNENIATLPLPTATTNGYLCIAPGTCRIRDAKERIICQNSTGRDFSSCSGKLGCCWDQDKQECYQYSDDLRTGAPYFYLARAVPISVASAPPQTPSPGGNNNDHDSGFLSTTTGKAVTFAAVGVVALVLIIAVVLSCSNKNKEGAGGGQFCLHEFVSKRYEVIRELGRGGFGTVYLAIRKSDRKELALKVIACSNEDDVQSALMEFNLLRETKPHPGMMQILDIHCSWDEDDEKKKKSKSFMKSSNSKGDLSSNIGSATDVSSLHSPSRGSKAGTSSPRLAAAAAGTEPLIDKKNNDDGMNNNANSSLSQGQGAKIEQQKFVCIVMEYYANGDLAQFVARSFEQGGGPAETWLWTVLAKQLFSVLAHLHAQSPPIVHRDIKPENLLMGGAAGDKTYNRICITDFGLAAQYERTFMSTRAGSFHYLAPECWSHRYTASVDVWSAGCILYASATGCVAPPAARVMFNDARHPSFPAEIREDLRNYSPDFANLVLSILKMDPNQRPTAQQLYETVSKKCQTMVRNGSDEDCLSTGSLDRNDRKAVGSVHMSDSSKSNVSVQ